jgi:hypothetical protein
VFSHMQNLDFKKTWKEEEDYFGRGRGLAGRESIMGWIWSKHITRMKMSLWNPFLYN